MPASKASMTILIPGENGPLSPCHSAQALALLTPGNATATP